MELANLWSSVGTPADGVRIARHDDAGALTDLLRQASFTHLHVDWHLAADWLGTAGFAVQQVEDGLGRATFTDALFGSRKRLEACLAVAADPPPAAWVRVVALRDLAQPTAVLGRMLALVEGALRGSAVEQLAWLPIDDWPSTWLTALGFRHINAIKGYIKQDLAVPSCPTVDGLIIRPVTRADFERLAAVEEAAFAPIWRNSADGMALAQQHCLSFDVAELDGRPVGFQFSTRSTYGVHLARMTVDPAYQRRGIGSVLLAHAIEGYERMGFRTMTLNTQEDNLSAQALYQRFGYRYTGQDWPIWGVDL